MRNLRFFAGLACLCLGFVWVGTMEQRVNTFLFLGGDLIIVLGAIYCWFGLPRDW